MDYSDMMHHPRYQLRHHAAMPEKSRAAQFSAFAALSGYDEEIDETARLTSEREIQCEDDIAELNDAFRWMLEHQAEHPIVTVLYFRPDSQKTGGAYLTYTGQFRHYDAEEAMLIFADQKRLLLREIISIMPKAQPDLQE